MPYDRFRRFSRAEGFCCPLALLTARKAWGTPELAEDAEVDERTIRYWRRKFRKGDLTCLNYTTCLLQRALQRDQKIP